LQAQDLDDVAEVEVDSDQDLIGVGGGSGP